MRRTRNRTPLSIDGIQNVVAVGIDIHEVARRSVVRYRVQTSGEHHDVEISIAASSLLPAQKIAFLAALETLLDDALVDGGFA